MLFRAPTIRPGIPKPLAGADFIADGNFQNGAVLMGPNSFIIGKSAFPATYALGVISFWANYDSSVSSFGDSAKILHLFGADSLNSPNQTACSFNAPRSLSAAQPTPIGCLGIFLTPQQMDFYLRDGLTGAPIVKVAIPYVKGDTIVANNWTKLGPISALAQIPPFTWNGAQFTLGSIRVMDPCGSDTLLSFNPCAAGSIQEGFSINTPADLPAPLPNSVSPVGPSPVLCVPVAQVQGDIWWVPGSLTGGTPTTGWHHYIISWDLTQTVTDTNGSTCVRVQAAIDRGGGPIQGGKIFDTSQVAVNLGKAQAFSSVLEYAVPNGANVLVTEPRNLKIDSDAWVIKTPLDASCKWAYMYFGIPRNGFFDLRAARPNGGINLDYFITPGLFPQNWGYQGHSVTPIASQWIHTGAADNLTSANVPYFQINNAASPFNFDGSFNGDSVWTSVGLPLVTSVDAPPLPSI